MKKMRNLVAAVAAAMFLAAGSASAQTVARVHTDLGQVVGGYPVMVTVTLNQPAPAGGLQLPVQANYPAYGPACVTVPAGATSVTFSVPTQQVPYQSPARVSVGGATTGFWVAPSAYPRAMSPGGVPMQPVPTSAPATVRSSGYPVFQPYYR
ncbi:MAG: hypothetical protein AB1758_16210 [Candidatus Eremiobacterota bacterium]